MKYIDEWHTALLLHDASLHFLLPWRRLEEFIAGVNMAVYEWHAHPHFRFLLISSPFCWPTGRFDQKIDLRSGNLSNLRTTPSEVLSHCISLFSVPSCISLLSGSKAPN